MSNIVSLKKARQTRQAQCSKEKTLCKHGFHRWTIEQEKQFDVKQGRLVTLYRCTRCGAQRVKAQ